jgi:aminopeptidase YwaD
MNTYRSFLFVLAISCSSLASAQTDPLVQKYFTELRKNFAEKNAYETVAFVEKRWRIAGNSGFNESIFYVEDILKKAGFVEEKIARPLTASPTALKSGP